jgi:hypothetical protein
MAVLAALTANPAANKVANFFILFSPLETKLANNTILCRTDRPTEDTQPTASQRGR